MTLCYSRRVEIYAYGGRQLIRFVLMGMPRTGSNYIVGMLYGHPNVLCHYDIANPNAVVGPMWNQDRLTFERRNADPIRFVADSFDPPVGKSAVGFKIFFGDFEPIVDYVMEHSSIAKIFISRANLLAAFSSQQIALVTSKWGARSANDLERVQIEFDVASFQHYMQYASEAYQSIKSLAYDRGHETLDVCYERLHDSSQKLAIFRLLGVPCPVDASFTSLKQNDSNILRRFSNPYLVTRHLCSIGHPEWAYEALM